MKKRKFRARGLRRVARTAKLSYSSDQDTFFQRLCIQTLELASGRKRINRVYQHIQETEFEKGKIWQAALEGIGIEVSCDRTKLSAIPADTPLVFISNHPFGIVDGLILGSIIASVRPDFAILVNHVLCGHDPRVEAHLLPIDFRETKAAMRTNIHTKQEALRRLKAGEAIGIFPAGGVATSPRPWGKAEDLSWKRFTAKIIQMSKATVVPLFFHGQNSRLFQVVSQFSMTLRLGLLINEARNKVGKPIQVDIGTPIPFEEIAHIKDRQALLDHLRRHTFRLGESSRSLS